MLCGTPSVTTEIGIEGMHSNLPWSGMVSNKPNVIAKNAIELYTNDKAWKLCQDNGIAIINQLFDKSVLEALLKQRIHTTINTLVEHRTTNFIGSMLLHHTMASTKYMSKWIEAKNQ